MGIRRWFAPNSSAAGRRTRLDTGADLVAGEPVRLTGTTTIGAEAVRALFTARRLPEGGLLHLAGQMVAEPENPADGQAVAVHVEGDRIGYLPGYLAARLELVAGDMLPCQVQLWGTPDRGRLRVVGWAAYGTGPGRWPHDAAHPPAVTSREQRAEAAAATIHMVDEALTGPDAARAADLRRGMVGRYHYLETVEPIRELKRQGRPEEALALCYGAIEAAEHDRGGREPAPWYTEQAAIVHRQRGEREQEIAVQQRWLRMCPPERRSGSRIEQRLAKLQG